ncbi:MAG: hypothetical protein R3C97_03270 [Geminicoccaceae bacterium]
MSPEDTLHKAYLELLEKDITKAFVYSFRDQADTLFQNYLDHAEAHVTKSKVKDPITRDEIQPDEGFLKNPSRSRSPSHWPRRRRVPSGSDRLSLVGP